MCMCKWVGNCGMDILVPDFASLRPSDALADLLEYASCSCAHAVLIVYRMLATPKTAIVSRLVSCVGSLAVNVFSFAPFSYT